MTARSATSYVVTSADATEASSRARGRGSEDTGSREAVAEAALLNSHEASSTCGLTRELSEMSEFSDSSPSDCRPYAWDCKDVQFVSVTHTVELKAGFYHPTLASGEDPSSIGPS